MTLLTGTKIFIQCTGGTEKLSYRVTVFFKKRQNFAHNKFQLPMAFKLYDAFQNYLLTKLKGGTL